MSTMLEFNDIRISYSTYISLHIPKLNISKGSMVGFVGNNGAGKTTIFKLLTDLILPDSGQVSIMGQNVNDSESWKFITSCYLDESFLMDYLTPAEYFNFIFKLKGIHQNEMDEQLKPFESLLPHQTFLHEQLIRNYSKGNIQKIGIVSCLILKPEILILD